MSPQCIPAWTAQGALPPAEAEQPTSQVRSPYQVSLCDVIQRFSTSEERREILDGFLRYREALHGLGLATGFQWLNGSFLEDIERREAREPEDLDVVTFFATPPELTHEMLLTRAGEAFFDVAEARAAYSVDGYLVSLALPPKILVRRSTYWYSLWSHRRDWTWKGYLEIDLMPDEDADARALLSRPQGPQS